MIGRLQRYCPFIASMAASDASKLAKLIKAKPLELPVSGSRMICKQENHKSNIVIWWCNNYSSYLGKRDETTEKIPEFLVLRGGCIQCHPSHHSFKYCPLFCKWVHTILLKKYCTGVRIPVHYDQYEVLEQAESWLKSALCHKTLTGFSSKPPLQRSQVN